jgi:uncharacterized spore protein YtfJ
MASLSGRGYPESVCRTSREGSVVLEDVLGRLNRIDEKASVRTVFGDPIQQNGRVIIPVAKVAYGFGFGGGRNAEKEPQEEESSEGAGGGGGVSVRPVAILEITEEETRIRPIVDVTRVALAGMVLLAWNIFWVTYTIRRAARSKT